MNFNQFSNSVSKGDPADSERMLHDDFCRTSCKLLGVHNLSPYILGNGLIPGWVHHTTIP